MVKLFGCTKKFWIMQLPIPYCVSFIVSTVTRHIFISILQMECSSGVKFVMGYEKNMGFPVIPKVLKKLEKIGWTPLMIAVSGYQVSYIFKDLQNTHPNISVIASLG